jgi:hypothetical protein
MNASVREAAYLHIQIDFVREILLTILYTFCLLLIKAQSVRSPREAVYTGLGAFSKNFKDVFSFADNPAGFSEAAGFSAGVSGEKRFMLEGMNAYAASLQYAMKSSAVGFNSHFFGSAGFQESQLSLAYGKNLGKLNLGVQFNYHRISVPAYGADGTISADISLVWELTANLKAGVHVLNPVPVKFGAQEAEMINTVYKMGMGYEISDKVFLGAELFKESGKQVHVYFALQYQFLAKFFFQAGINTEKGKPYAGFGWAFRNLRLHINGSYHPQLGFTPGMMLLFNASKSK